MSNPKFQVGDILKYKAHHQSPDKEIILSVTHINYISEVIFTDSTDMLGRKLTLEHHTQEKYMEVDSYHMLSVQFNKDLEILLNET